MPNVFICPRCHYETEKTSTFLKHLTKANACHMTFTDEPRESIINSFKSRSFECPHCVQTFSDASHLSRHVNRCKSKELHEMRSTIEDLANKVKMLEHTNSNITINNNTTTINNGGNTYNIQVVNNFGNEDRSHVTREILMKCLDGLDTDSLHSVPLPNGTLARFVIHGYPSLYFLKWYLFKLS